MIPPPVLPSESETVPNSPSPVRQANSRAWLWFFLIISLLINGIFGTLAAIRRSLERGETASPFIKRTLESAEQGSNKIAVIRIEGLISSNVEGHMGVDGMVGDIREELRLATIDKDVKAIILRIDSPGGEVLASDEIYRAVRSAREKKPVVCSMGSVAASGGYYSAMGASWIIADDLTITGSIGVIMQTFNYKDLFGKIGLKSVVLKSGKFKDLLDGSRDVTPEELAMVQNIIMETYEKFLRIVAHERKLDPELLRHGIADGRVFSGKQALAVKLVDQNGTFQDAVKKAKNLANIKDAEIFEYVVPFSFKNILAAFVESHSPRIDVNLAPQRLQLQQGKLYYLSMHIF